MPNLLDTPLIATLGPGGRGVVERSLAGVMAALVRGEVADFPRLRPHQRHVWHALLVTLAALALGDGAADPPDDEAAWRLRLLALTPDHPDGAAWALAGPPDRPAFLQPPSPGGSLAGFKPVATPDALDMLVSSKRHDLKAGAMADALPEHWLHALVSLQTQDGYPGRTYHGISRMNTGYGNRPGLGIEPGPEPGRRFLRDLRRMPALRAAILRTHEYRAAGGLALVWLRPWDGAGSIQPRELDPFYIEICRRVRLVADTAGRLSALTAGSTAARIEAKAAKGFTGDPWTPVVTDKDGPKALTVNADGFSYRRLVPLLFPKPGTDAVRKAPLQDPDAADAPEGLAILARALVRGQGKTEGFHERRVPVSATMRRGFGSPAVSDAMAACAHSRVEDAARFARQVLYPAVLSVFTGAPRTDQNERKRDDDTAKNRVRRLCDRFDGRVDETFFDALDEELAVLGDADACHAVRGRWLLHLRDLGRETLDQALDAAPQSAARGWRVRVQALGLFDGCFRKHFADYLPATVNHPEEAGA